MKSIKNKIITIVLASIFGMTQSIAAWNMPWATKSQPVSWWSALPSLSAVGAYGTNMLSSAWSFVKAKPMTTCLLSVGACALTAGCYGIYRLHRAKHFSDALKIAKARYDADAGAQKLVTDLKAIQDDPEYRRLKKERSEAFELMQSVSPVAFGDVVGEKVKDDYLAADKAFANWQKRYDAVWHQIEQNPVALQYVKADQDTRIEAHNLIYLKSRIDSVKRKLYRFTNSIVSTVRGWF